MCTQSQLAIITANWLYTKPIGGYNSQLAVISLLTYINKKYLLIGTACPYGNKSWSTGFSSIAEAVSLPTIIWIPIRAQNSYNGFFVLISNEKTSVLRKQKKTVVFAILISKETRTCTQHPYISTKNQRQRCNFGDAAEAGAPAFAAVPASTSP